MKNITCSALLISILLFNVSYAVDQYEYVSNKIAVSISESVDGIVNKSLSTCKNAIERELAKKGYHVVHNKYVENFNETNIFERLIEEENMVTTSATLDSLGGEGAASIAGEKEISKIVSSIQNKVKADILIIGKTDCNLLSEEPTIRNEYAGIYSARANGQFKVIWAHSGMIIATMSDIQSGADVTSRAASEKALTNLGISIGAKIAEEISPYEDM